jgi:hypothetical protein
MLAAIGHNSVGRVRCIFRSHGDRSYTKLRNGFLQDRRISDETRGLIARLLSLPDDWEVTVQSIIASGKAGRDKVYRMLKEAEEFGYILPEQGRKQAGKFDRQLYLVSDDPDALIERAAQEILEIQASEEPLTEKPEAAEQPLTPSPFTEKPEAAESVGEQGVSPLTGLPLTAEPFTAEPLTEKPEADKINIRYKNNPPIVPPSDQPAEPERRKRSAVPDEYPHDFEEFWKIYPRREGKAAALKVWERLKLPQKRRAYTALKAQLPALSAKARDRRGNFCPLPATWIGQGRFDDEPAPPNPEPNPPLSDQRSFAQQRADAEREALARDVERIRRLGPIKPLCEQIEDLPL